MSEIEAKQPFEIPERSITDAQGKTFGGKRARVYWLLLLARKNAARFPVGGGRLSEPGWVPIWACRAKWAGGVQGDRRLRELRTLHRYQVQRKIVEGTETTVYRIGSPEHLTRQREPAAPPHRVKKPLRGAVARFVDAPGAAADEIALEPGHVLWPGLGGHHAEGWVEQMRGAWRRRELASWIGRRELVIVLRPEDADSLLFDLRHSLAEVLRTLGADVRP